MVQMWTVIAATLSCVAAAATVQMHPGDDLQAIVDAHPPGTTYLLAAGTYRLQEIAPKTGDRYVGKGGLDPDTATILTGARVLTAFGPSRFCRALLSRLGALLFAATAPGF